MMNRFGFVLLALVIMVGFGLLSWLVSLPFAGAYTGIQWIEHHVAHPALVVPSLIALGFAALIALGARTTRRRIRPRV